MTRFITLSILFLFISVNSQVDAMHNDTLKVHGPQKKPPMSLNSIIWFPDSLNIQPFTANFLEPKLGFAFHIGSNNLRLDISNSRDVYLNEHLRNDGGSTHITAFSAGVDLFTFTRLRREEDFHFPVETIDYMFGINAGFKSIGKWSWFQYMENNGVEVFFDGPGEWIEYEYGVRFRLSHISAHLVDGKYDYQINGWRDNDHPRVYSREFIEVFPYYKVNNLRLYAGVTYLFHVTPKELGRDIYQLGFDYFLKNIHRNKILPEGWYPFVAYDFKLEHIYKYSGSNIISAGIKFGNPDGPGCSIQYSYISGRSIHGEYFDRNESYSTIGLNIDL